MYYCIHISQPIKLFCILEDFVPLPCPPWPPGSEPGCARKLYIADSQPSAVLTWKTLENHSDLGRTVQALKAKREHQDLSVIGLTF